MSYDPADFVGPTTFEKIPRSTPLLWTKNQRVRVKEIKRERGQRDDYKYLAKHQACVDYVIGAIDMGLDPMRSLLSATQLWTERKDQPGAPVTDEAKAGTVLQKVYSSREFGIEVQRRSKRAGEILDLCFVGLKNMVITHLEERQENPDIKRKDAKVTNELFARVSDSLMKFYKDTQGQIIKNIGATQEIPMEEAVSTLSDADLKALASGNDGMPPPLLPGQQEEEPENASTHSEEESESEESGEEGV